MKVKKHINEEINGFIILDSYVKITETGKKSRKVLLRCADCGREFERQSGVDFDHIKCKCKCQPEPNHYIKYLWNGKELFASELCRINGISEGTFSRRIKDGMTAEEALQKEFKKICPICDKEFYAKYRSKKYCGNTCLTRAAHGKGRYKRHKFRCVVCGKECEGDRFDLKTCSKECRHSLDKINRNKRYKRLKEQGRFDESVTLANVFEKYKGICQECGKELSFDSGWRDDDYPSIDHIIPLSKDGAHEWDNVQLLCRKCNYIKGNG